MLLLLDIDGVLVPAKSWERPEQLNDGFSNFHPKAVMALNKVLTASGASIILTTSHRKSFSIDKWIQIFSTRGIHETTISILNLNSDRRFQTRALEIQDWYNFVGENENFVVIDDDTSLNDLPPRIKRRCVITKPYIGLDDAGADDAIRIFRGGIKFNS